MAIAYSGPRGQTLQLQVNSGINGEGAQNIYLETIIRDIQPLLQAPFILNLIKNTNNDSSRNEFKNTRYYYDIKSTDASLVSSSTVTFNDPRNLQSENLTTEVRQLSPIEYAKKFSGWLRDLLADGLSNIAAQHLAGFIHQRRLKKQELAFNDCLYWANQVQTKIIGEDANATTFEAGAHVVQTSYSTADAIYEDLAKAIQQFQRLGAYNSKQSWNQSIPYLNGVPKSDMLILMSDEVASILLKVPGLFASDSGLDLFKKLGLKNILGVECLITSQLPIGVNFMIITTGIHGSIGYEEIGDLGIKTIAGKSIPVLNTIAVMVPDPNWSQAYRIDYVDRYKMGVILEDTIFVSMEAGTTIPSAPLNPKITA